MRSVFFIIVSIEIGQAISDTPSAGDEMQVVLVGNRRHHRTANTLRLSACSARSRSRELMSRPNGGPGQSQSRGLKPALCWARR
jgi:hypothetical protein